MSSESFHPGLSVWIPHPKESWVSAEVVSDVKDGVLVITEAAEEIKVARDKIFIKNPEILEGVPDLSQLSFLHEPGILYNLYSRYQLDLIYTYIGKILIAINPYARVPLYGKDMINAYYGQPLGALAPHVYAIAQDAFKDMRMEGTSQSILVSGESGAGKTETTKVLLQYFAAMGGLLKSNPNTNSHVKKDAVSEKSIEDRVLESTPLLEAFGNSKTLRNDNSSRFGKFIEIHFDEFGYIVGAKIQTYLLEKSRIFKQVPRERNYHIFYQLLLGADEEMRNKLHLLEPDQYVYLNQSGCYEVDDVSDEDQFKKTLHALSVSGNLDKQEQEYVFRLLSTVLWLGNITFRKSGEGSAVVDVEALNNSAELIGCNPSDLERVLITRKMVAKNESYEVSMSAEQAGNARDTLSMMLYSQMFDWLVSRINRSIQITGKIKPKSFIGILDIYGFEAFEKNSFEQFCINYANEKLQGLFNQHVFKEEQQEYIKEKLDWSYVDFVDNQDTLDLIEKKPKCVLSVLDEESTFPKSTGLTFANKLYATLEKHPRFEKPRFGTGTFTILHYAGKVTYDTEAFLDKNKDFTIPEQLALLQKCSNPFIATLLKHTQQTTPADSKAPSQFKFTSVGSQFSTSLNFLMKTICSTTPHYIRCVKPNQEKQPQVFIKDEVMHQLKCGGVMESVRICSAGYPTRRLFGQFYERYRILHNKKGVKAGATVPKQQVAALMESLKFAEDKYKMGLTKIFLRAGEIAKLEDLRNVKQNESALMIQKHFKGYTVYRAYLQLRKSALRLQTIIRRILAVKFVQSIRRLAAAIKIQTAYRAYTKRFAYHRLRKAALRVQQRLRSNNAHKKLVELKLLWASILLQTLCRTAARRIDYNLKLKGIRRLQAKWRGKLARREYTKLRIEARSVRSLQDAKSKLEQKIEEMQWRLSAEMRAREREKDELTKHLELEKQKSVAEAKKHAVPEEEYIKLKNKISELETERDELKSTRSVYESKMNELIQLNDKLEHNVQTMLSNFSIEAERAETKTRQLREVSEKSGSDMEAMKAKLAALEKERDSLLARLGDVEKGRDELRVKYGDVDKERDGLLVKLSYFEEENATHKENLVALRTEIEQLKEKDAKGKAWAEETETYNTRIQEYEIIVKVKEEEQQKQAQEMENIKLGLAGMEAELAQKDNSLQKVKEQHDSVKKELEKTIEDNRIIAKEKDDHLQQFSSQIKALQQELNNLGANNGELAEKTDNLVSLLALANTSNDALKSEKSNLESTLTKDIEDLRKLISQTQKEIQHLSAQKMEMTAEITTKNETIAGANTLYQNLEGETLQLKEKMRVLEHEISSDKQKIMDMEKSATSSAYQLHKAQDDCERLKAELAKIEQQNERMREEKEKRLREEIEHAAKLEIESTKTEMATANLRQELERTRGELERQAHTLKITEENHKRTVSEYKESILKLENDIKQLQGLRAKFEDDFFGMKEKSISETHETAYLQERNSQLTLNVTRLEIEISERKKSTDKLYEEIDIYKKDLANLQLETHRTHDKMQALTQENEAQAKKKSKMKDTITKLTAKLELKNSDLESVKNNHTVEVTNFHKIVDELREQLAKQTGEVYKYQIASQNQDNTIAALVSDKQKLSTANEDLKNQRKDLKRQIGVLQESLLKLETTVMMSPRPTDTDHLKKEVEDLRRDLNKTLLENATLLGELSHFRQYMGNFGDGASLMRKGSGTFENTEKVMAEYEKTVEALERDKSESNQRIKDLEMEKTNEVGIVERKLEEAVANAQMWENKAKDLQRQVEEAGGSEADAKADKAKINKLEQDLLSKDTKIRNIEDERIKLSKEITHLQDELNTLSKRLAAVTSEAQALKKQDEETSKLYQNILKEYNEMRKQLVPLQYNADKLVMLEKVADMKETNWEKLARSLGHVPAMTRALCADLLLQNTDQDRTLAPIWLVFHQLAYWKALELENIPILQVVIESLAGLIPKSSEDLDNVAYLLSGSSFLLYILTKSSKGNMDDEVIIPLIDVNSDTKSSHHPSPSQPQPSPTEAAYLTLPPIKTSRDFFANMKTIVSKCYSLLLINVYKKLDPLLEMSILIENFGKYSKELLPSLDNVTSFLLQILIVFQTNMVHITFSEQFFSEIFNRINALLLNGILLRQQFCTDAYGNFLKQKLGALEEWADEVGSVWMGDFRSALLPIKQVAVLLTLKDKAQLVEEKHRKALCPSLTAIQIRQILAMYTPGEYGKRVPISVINAIKPPPASAKNIEESRILEDLNTTRSFPIRILHYFDVSDMFQISVPPNMKSHVEEYARMAQTETL